MQQDDFEEFTTLIGEVYAFKARDISEFAIRVWWNAMQRYDLAAVREAINRHFANPDAGQFLPMPADIVKMLEGRSVDSASLAWAEVDKAVRRVGPYQSVTFADPITAAVIEQMGGWVELCRGTDQEWPFIAKRFETIYQGYKMRSMLPEAPDRQIGIAEAYNGLQGFESTPPVLIGQQLTEIARRRLN